MGGVYTGNLPADSARPPPAGAPGGLHGNYFKGHGDAALARVRGDCAPSLRAFDICTLPTLALAKAVVFSPGSGNPKGTLESAPSRYG